MNETQCLHDGEATTLYRETDRVFWEENGTLQGVPESIEFVVKCFIQLQDHTYEAGIDAVVEEIKRRLEDLDGLLAQHGIDINVYVGPGEYAPEEDESDDDNS